ncbi:MAG: hypothetical protein NT098_05025 [Candidatus Parcubacteria bacterium]|nr:hypothetical protein [Candidatus Parcubacteria bacterium]
MSDTVFYLKGIALAYALYFIVSMAREAFANISFVPFIWKRVHPKMVVEVFGILILVVGIMILLMMFVPFMRIGWMNFFAHEGGNIILKPFTDLAESSDYLIRCIPVILLAVLIFLAPFIVKVEEEIFRYGHTEWGAVSRQSVKFGLIHLVLGIPLAAPVALTFLGFFLGYKYRKAYLETLQYCGEDLNMAHSRAIATSIVYHTVFDCILFVFLLVGLIVSFF